MTNDVRYFKYAWGPLLLHFKYPKKYITKLKRICKKVKTKNGHQSHLAGIFPSGNQDSFKRQDRLWFYRTIEPYFEAWSNAGVDYYGWKEAPRLKPHTVWVNHMKPGDFNPPHIHDGNVTFVLFVD